MTDMFEITTTPVPVGIEPAAIDASYETDTPDFPNEVVEAPSDGALACLTCGKPLRYGGHGRKPRYCDEHKTKTKRAPGRIAANDATVAAEALASLNITLALALTFVPFEPVRLPKTANAISENNDVFKVEVEKALLSAPHLAARIASAGGVTGVMGLVAAYAMLGMAIAPTALDELKAKREIGA